MGAPAYRLVGETDGTRLGWIVVARLKDVLFVVLPATLEAMTGIRASYYTLIQMIYDFASAKISNNVI